MIAAAAMLQASSSPTCTLLAGDGTANRLNMVFLGDGYTQAQQAQFITDVQANMKAFFACPPWGNYRNYCNVYAISVVSAQSGADHPQQGTSVSTYFEATFGTGSMERLVTLGSYNKVTPLLTQFVPGYDFVCVLVNDPEYGGSGGSIAVATMNSASTFLILHETGHSFANLADEYTSAYTSAQEMKNVTAHTTRDQIRWNIWIAASTPLPTPATSAYYNVIGIFEGAMYQTTGWYRPKYDCTMRSAGVLKFCEVCREEVAVGIYNRISAIDTSFPSHATTVANAAGATLIVKPMTPDSFKLAVKWIVNGTAIAATSDTLLLSNAGLRTGANTVTVRATDTTSMVRIPGNLKFLTDSVTWNVNSTTGVLSGAYRDALARQVRVVSLAHGIMVGYFLAEPQSVTVHLRDLRGILRYSKSSGMQSAGAHEMLLSGMPLAAGVYVAEFVSAGTTVARIVDLTR
jgi:hypothetical protein